MTDPPPPTTPHPIDPELRADRDRLIAILAPIGIAVAVITFDGSGDEGQIEESPSTTPPTSALISRHHGRARDPDVTSSSSAFPPPRNDRSAHCARLPRPRKFTYDTLFDLHGGWEDNAGAFGESRSMSRQECDLDFNVRIIDAHNTFFEL